MDRLSRAASTGVGTAQDRQGIAAGQVLEGLQRRGVVLAQRTAQSVRVAGSGPDQILMSPRQDLDRLDSRTVPGDLAVVVAVGAYQVSQ